MSMTRYMLVTVLACAVSFALGMLLTGCEVPLPASPEVGSDDGGISVKNTGDGNVTVNVVTNGPAQVEEDP